MELIGDRWTYPLLRELMLAPKRFGELLGSVRGITPAVLTSRLRELERTGLVQRVVLPAPARVPAYQLTAWGRELDPVMQSLGRWAQTSPTRTVDGAGLTPDAAIQSMRTMAPPVPPEPPITMALHLFDARLPADPGYDYRIRWDTAGLRAERGTITRASSRVSADSSTWARVLYEGLRLNSAGIHLDGEPEPVQRLVDAFAEHRAPQRAASPQ